MDTPELRPRVHVDPDKDPSWGVGPEPDPGTHVLYALHRDDPAAIKQAIPQANSHKEGDVLGAVVVRCWGPGMVNLMVFIDGPRPWWCTSVPYSQPTLVEGIDAAAGPIFSVAARSWHDPVEHFLDRIKALLHADALS